MNRKKTPDLTCIAKSLRPLAVAIDKLLTDPANARTHGSKNLDAIKGSLRTYGQQKPVVVRKETMTVVAGNGTLEAAKLLGWTHLAASVVEMDATTAAAFAIADNRTAELAEWDTEALDNLLASIPEGTDELIDQMLADLRKQELPPAPIVEDDVPDPPKIAVTKPGDLYLLGEHRLLCGDSTKAEDVARVMGGASADVCLTDPPYNVGFDYGERAKDDRQASEYMSFSAAWFMLAKSISPVVVFTPGTGRGPGHPNLKMWFAIEWPFWIVAWIKKNAVGHSSLGGFNNWEPLLVYGKPANKVPQDIYDIPITVQADVADENGRKLHPVPKQVKFFAAVLEDFSEPSQLIYEPFAGSGTTIIAAEQLSRRCFGLEIEPRYCDVIVARWEKFTGKKARRE